MNALAIFQLRSNYSTAICGKSNARDAPAFLWESVQNRQSKACQQLDMIKARL